MHQHTFLPQIVKNNGFENSQLQQICPTSYLRSSFLVLSLSSDAKLEEEHSFPESTLLPAALLSPVTQVSPDLWPQFCCYFSKCLIFWSRWHFIQYCCRIITVILSVSSFLALMGSSVFQACEKNPLSFMDKVDSVIFVKTVWGDFWSV